MQKIIIGDCLTIMEDLQNQSIDAVVTSPPYNLNISYSMYDDKKPRDQYLNWIQDIGAQIARILKPDGSFFLNIGNTNVDPWLAFDVASTLRDIFVLQNNIIWIKSISIDDNTVGHFKPINSKRFLNNNFENIFHLTLTGNAMIDRLAVGVPFKDKTNVSRRSHSQDKRCAGNIRFIPYETVQTKSDKFNHPAIFPVELPEFCLKLLPYKGVVLDPFMGVGTTLIAAKKLGWDSIGIEIDKTYANIAKRRLKRLSLK